MTYFVELTRQSWFARVLVCVLIGSILAWGFSEVTFIILRDQNNHAPSRIELVIPAGTAERVAAGQSIPAIPPEMSFVIGDVLVVNNQDSVSHQLGPLWVPPGARANLAMEIENQYAYACTFQPSQYLGLDVRPRVTMQTRIQAILLAGLPMGMLMFAYSLAAWPLTPKIHATKI